MKILVQCRPWVDGVRMNGRIAYLGKVNDALTIDTIYTTDDTANCLNEYDLTVAKDMESRGLIKIVSITQ